MICSRSTKTVEYTSNVAKAIIAKPKRRSRVGTGRPFSPLEVPTAIRIRKPVSVAALANRDLERIAEILGLNQAARILDVDRSQLSRCMRGAEGISSTLALRITNLQYVLTRALQVMHADEVGPWLTEGEPLLGGSIPLNVLAIDGPAPVIAALDALVSGAFA
jgi:hypothetical protein